MQFIKSRSQSIFEFFETLQVEWIVCNLRYRIYPDPIDKRFWQKVADGKKAKIQSIADKNMLPTIFTDDELKDTLEKRIINPISLPTFTYRDERQREMQEVWDLKYYYDKGAEVRFEVMGELKIGNVKKYSPRDPELIVIERITLKEYTVPVALTTRIL